jgi:succinate dehydrogenase/fumarate reductase-like Fe-S protein
MTVEPIAVLNIARGTAQDSSVERFEVPFTEGASILDGLMWIRDNIDPTLAFRFSCISANVCKECVMQVNGKNRYACVERLIVGETLLEPLRSKVVIRDLATQSVPPKERLRT